MGRRKSKTHEEDLARVRENQRRHRARIKDQASALEGKLAEKDALLAKAEERIAELTAALEFERLQTRERRLERASDESLHVTPDTAPADWVSPTNLQYQPTSVSLNEGAIAAGRRPCEGCCPWVYLSTGGTAKSDPPSSLGDKGDPTNDALTLTGSSSYIETVELAMKQCLDLDPPRFGESTTLCITAYNLIDQQNYRGLETSTMYQWLRQGFRSGHDQLDSCRVENGILFSLLDFVSST